MRIRQYISLLVASFMVVVLAAPAAMAQTDYTNVTVVGSNAVTQSDGSISASFQLDPLFAPGSRATITGANGATVSFTVPASGLVQLNLPAGFGNNLRITGVTATGASVEGSTFLTVVGQVTATSVPVTVATSVPVTVATSVPVATAVPVVAMAVTGSSTRVPVLLGVSLLGVGGLALFAARRRQMSV